MSVTSEQIALAMELRSTGMIWRLIGYEVGLTAGQIKGAVARATR